MQSFELKRKQKGFYNYVKINELRNVDIVSMTGHGKGNVSSYVNRKLEPSSNFLELFEKSYNINLDDFEFLESQQHNVNNDVENSEIMIPKDGLKPGIPYYNVDFAGGWDSEEIFSVGNPDFYINNPEFDRSEFACNLVGHSISRRIPNRSIIGLKLIEDWQTYFPTNELYGVVMKNELRTVKIVKRSKEKRDHLILIPDPLPEYNQIKYEEEEVPINFVSKFYQITAWAQFERVSQ